MPPAIRTWPFVSVVEVCRPRASSMLGPAENVFVTGSKISVETSSPVNSDSGFCRSSAERPPGDEDTAVAHQRGAVDRRAGPLIVNVVVVCATGS
jgi:hypothetical protein